MVIIDMYVGVSDKTWNRSNQMWQYKWKSVVSLYSAFVAEEHIGKLCVVEMEDIFRDGFQLKNQKSSVALFKVVLQNPTDLRNEHIFFFPEWTHFLNGIKINS